MPTLMASEVESPVPQITGVPSFNPVSSAALAVTCPASFVHKTGFCHLVRAAEQCTFLLIDLCLIVVERTEGSLCQKLVNDIFSCELGGNIGRAGQKLVGFGINLRLVVLGSTEFWGQCRQSRADGQTAS